MLAISEFLILNDGHSSNIIAMETTPVLIDAETVFQNYSSFSVSGSDILRMSSLIDFYDQEQDLWMAGGFSYLLPYSIDELKIFVTDNHTDLIDIKYRGDINLNRGRSLPYTSGHQANIRDYIDEVIEGYRNIYPHLTRLGYDFFNTLKDF